MGKTELVMVLEERNKELIQALCGPEYHPIPACRYKRAGTKRRMLGTRFGIIEIKVSRVLDTWTGKSVIPLWKDIIIKERCLYQLDVIQLSINGTLRMTYRDTNRELSRTIGEVPSPRTINRRVMQEGDELNRQILERELVATTHQPDGTRLPAKNGGHHDMGLVVATKNGKEPQIRGILVGKKWSEFLPSMNRTSFQDEHGRPIPPTLVSDMENGLANVLTPINGYWQACLVHVVRYTRHSLWLDGIHRGEQERAIVNTVVSILKHLKNSVALHLPNKEFEAVEHRIKQTIKEFRRLASRLNDIRLSKTAVFLRDICNNVTTFATLAIKGIMIPWHNNLVERMMGEVSKRFKHKWMTWTERGAQALLSLLLTRIVEPKFYKEFWDRKLYDGLHKLPEMGIQINFLGSSN
jgi:hypothetical protein